MGAETTIEAQAAKRRANEVAKTRREKTGGGPVRAAVLRSGRNLRPLVNRVVAKYSEIGDAAVFPTELFPWAVELERNWEVIRAELDAVLRARAILPPLNTLAPDHTRITNDSDWKSFFLWGYGYRNDANCRRCPETARLVEQVPGLLTALFGVLEPGGVIKRHKGVTKAMLTCHMGLRVPKRRERCYMQLEGEQDYVWEEGRAFVWDDTFKHGVVNDTDELRVILHLHVLRPMRFPGSLLGHGFLRAVRMSPFVQDARRNMIRWEGQYGAALDRELG